MSSAVPAFVEHCSELLAPLGAVRARRMFGGWGLTLDGLFVAIIMDERLYLKADASSRPLFERAGCTPFVYQAKGQTMSLGYWTPPAEALEAPALMQPWARLALQAALSARAKTARPRRAAGATPKPVRQRRGPGRAAR